MATNNAVNIATAATGKILRAQGVGTAPLFSTATYPDTAGTSGNVLTSDGTNFISSAPATFSQVVTQIFTASGTYTPTSGMKYCIVELVGGGGGGGGAATTSSVQVAAGGGGGGGGYIRRLFSAATIGASQTVTIGAAGTAGASTPADGGTGGATIFGAFSQANGGVGGKLSNATILGTVGGGTGGTAIGSADFGCNGAPGGAGLAIFSTTAFLSSGFGGCSFFGGGGIGRVVTANGITGLSYGGGGSGAACTNNAGVVGGAGFAGIIVVTEYI